MAFDMFDIVFFIKLTLKFQYSNMTEKWNVENWYITLEEKQCFWKVETVMEKWKISPGNTVDCNFFLIMSLISVILAQIIKK